MAWVRIDDGFADHPKTAEAGPLGMALQVAALCWCNRNLTDGALPRAQVPRLINFDGMPQTWRQVADELVRLGIWDVTDTGWQIHDYLQFQPSKDQVQAERATNAERMRNLRAGGRSAPVQPAQPSHNGPCEMTPDPDPDPDPDSGSVPEPGPKPTPRDPEARVLLTDVQRFEARTGVDIVALMRIEAVHPRPGGKGEAAPQLVEASRLHFDGNQPACAAACVENLTKWQRAAYLERPPDKIPTLATYLEKCRWSEPNPKVAPKVKAAFVPDPKKRYGRLCDWHEDRGNPIKQEPPGRLSETAPHCNACEAIWMSQGVSA